MTKNKNNYKTVTVEEWNSAIKLNEELRKEYKELVEKTKFLHYLILNDIHMDILPEEEYKKLKELFEQKEEDKYKKIKESIKINNKEENINNNNNLINQLIKYYSNNLIDENKIDTCNRSEKLFMIINLINNNKHMKIVNTIDELILSIEDKNLSEINQIFL